MKRLIKIFFIILFLFFAKADFASAEVFPISNEYQISQSRHDENVVRRSKDYNVIISNLTNVGISKSIKRNQYLFGFCSKFIFSELFKLTQTIEEKKFNLKNNYSNNLISYEILPNAP